MLFLYMRHGPHAFSCELPMHLANLVDGFGSIGVDRHPWTLPLTGTEEIGVELRGDGPVGHALLRKELNGTLGELNELCHAIRSAFPLLDPDLPDFIDRSEADNVKAMSRDFLDFVEDKRDWVVRVSLFGKKGDVLIKMPASARRLAATLKELGIQRFDECSVGVPEFLYEESAQNGTFPYSLGVMGLNDYAQALEPWLCGSQKERDVTHTLALLEAYRPSTGAEARDLMARRGQYRVYPPGPETARPYAEIILSEEGVNPDDHSPQALSRMVTNHMQEHKVRWTRNGYVRPLSEDEPRWEDTPRPQNATQLLVIVSNDNVWDGVSLPMRSEDLEEARLCDKQEAGIDEVRVMDVQTTGGYQPLADCLNASGEQDIREMNHLVKAMTRLEPLHRNTLLGACGEMKSAGAGALLEVARDIQALHTFLTLTERLETNTITEEQLKRMDERMAKMSDERCELLEKLLCAGMEGEESAVCMTP